MPVAYFIVRLSSPAEVEPQANTDALIETKKDDRFHGRLTFGGEGGTRTLAPVTRPTPLAGLPRHQLEYFSKLISAFAPIQLCQQMIL